MRNEDQIRERIKLAIIEEMQSTHSALIEQPERIVPNFIEALSANLTDIVMDEILIRRRY